MYSPDEVKIVRDKNGSHVTIGHGVKISKKQFFELLATQKNLYELIVHLDTKAIKLCDIVKSKPAIKKLAYCNFHDHTLKGITASEVALAEIEELYVDWYGRYWPKWIFALPKVKTLELCSADIQSLPKEIYEMRQLEELDIHLCPSLMFSIRKMKRIKTLKWIHAESSQIQQFPYMENYTPVSIEMPVE